MTRTPDEIKKGLECCTSRDCGGSKCPYFNEKSCNAAKSADALALIQQKKQENAEQAERIQQLEAERDFLLKYLTDSHFVPCDICKHDIDGSGVMGCKRVREIKGPCFEWRGVQKEDGNA